MNNDTYVCLYIENLGLALKYRTLCSQLKACHNKQLLQFQDYPIQVEGVPKKIGVSLIKLGYIAVETNAVNFQLFAELGGVEIAKH